MAGRRDWLGPARLLILPLLLMAVAGCGGPAASGGDAMPPFQSWQARRYNDVVRQQTDFTCGAASLSTISTHYYGRPIKEDEFTKTIRARHSEEAWQRREQEGLSLLDMKLAAETLGFQAEGLKMTLTDARTLAGPVVVHLDKGYMKHFAVLRAIEGDRAYIADPILGNVRVPLWRFTRQWTGYALAIWIEGQDLPLPHQHKLVVDAADLTHETPAARRALYVTPLPLNIGPT